MKESPDTSASTSPTATPGATPQEVLSVLQMVSVLGIHSVALGVPMLAEELAARGQEPPGD